MFKLLLSVDIAITVFAFVVMLLAIEINKASVRGSQGAVWFGMIGFLVSLAGVCAALGLIIYHCP